MDRREFLSTSATLVASLAGCAGQTGRSATTTVTPVPLRSDDPDATPPSSADDLDLPIPMAAFTRGAARDVVPAITDPAFGPDWRPADADVPLTDVDQVIGVVRGGDARAYPLAVLNWHEVVNDDFHGPLLVTFCPLCDSAVTAVRQVGGEATVFGVSGLLWRDDLVMYDRATESLWSQIAAMALRGPRTGDRLELVPSGLATWGDWRSGHPDTEVLLPPPASGTIRDASPRPYHHNPYKRYEGSRQIGVGSSGFDDNRLPRKEQVLGIEGDGAVRAYPISAVRAERVVNDVVGDAPVVVTLGSLGDTIVAYDRRVDGTTLVFETADARHIRGGGSRWHVGSGRAVDGPYEGSRLRPATERSQMFWFAWLAFYPDTEVYGRSCP